MTECPAVDGSSPRTTSFPEPPPMCIDPAKSYEAEMVTSMGTLRIRLFADKAPITVNNFVFLARYHYYDGLTFHRVIQNFVLQGGCPEGSGRGNPGYRFEDELPGPGEYKLGSLAMANAGPNTNGSQFFVISGPNGVQLPPQYALFGQVIDGLEHVEVMQAVATGAGDKPKTDMIIESVTITES